MDRSHRVVVAIASVVFAVLAYLSAGGLRRAVPPTSPPGSSASGLAGGSERDNRVLGEIDLARLFPDLVLRQGDVAAKNVALTFDDGPDKQYTPQILDVLARKGVRATFFLIGNRLAESPEVVRRILAEGHAVGNHTYSHPNITTFTAQDIERELRTADREMSRFGARVTGMFRPPYGAVGVSSVEPLARAGYSLCLWTVDSLDWRGLTREQVINNVLPLVANGSVILFHSAGGPGEDLSGTVGALPVVIDDLRAKGFKFVTLPEMFPRL
ncbi:MAG: polysaccharide deacetylase family protein [Firmicutes bacterium]|nr:polysaccharide deacetylase family protein [Bacillota bacterium]